MVIIVIAIIYFSIKGLKNYFDDIDMRNFSVKNGLDFYASSSGLRSTKTGKRGCFKNGKFTEF